jgi:Tfp pilus assembly protein PilF
MRPNVELLLLVLGGAAGILQAADITWRFIKGEENAWRGLWWRLPILLLCCAVAFWSMRGWAGAADEHFRRATECFSAKDRAGALTEADACIAIQPSHTGALKLQGACRGIDGDHTGAAEAYRRAVKVDPEDAEAYLGLATAAEAAGLRQEAIGAFRMVTRLPNAQVAQRRLAEERMAALAKEGGT